MDVAAIDLFASIDRPVAADVRACGARLSVEPARIVFASSPWVVLGEGSEITVEWTNGSFREQVEVEQDECADTLRLLLGARRITELEGRMTPASAAEIEPGLVRLSQEYGLASRVMALVAVVHRPADAPGLPPVTEVVPVGMLGGTEFESYFDDAVDPSVAFRGSQFSLVAENALDLSMAEDRAFRHVLRPASLYRKLPAPDGTDALLEIASYLEPDGGAPGNDTEDRALKTTCALLLFLSYGNTPAEGAFRAHVERMARFLETLDLRKELLSQVAAFARAGKKPLLAQVDSWADIEAAIGVQRSASATDY